MNFDPEVIHRSKLPGFEDVSFTLHQYTEGKRLEFRIEMAETNARVRDMQVRKAEAEELTDPAERKIALTRVYAEMTDVINDNMNVAWYRLLVVSIQGLTIRNEPATPESLISSGPRPLYLEILDAVQTETAGTAQTSGELKPLTTSAVVADGPIADTNVIHAVARVIT